jgi:hypothetical protein
MKTTTSYIVGLACGILLLGTTTTFAQKRHALPPNNPFLIQNSVYPSVHFDSGQTDTTSLPVWRGDSKLEPSQVQWLPGLNAIGTQTGREVWLVKMQYLREELFIPGGLLLLAFDAVGRRMVL